MSDQENKSVVELVTTKSDADIAADLKLRAGKTFTELCSLMDEASRQGLVLSWAGVQPMPPMMKHGVVGLTVAKHF